MQINKPKVIPELIVTASISGGLAIVLSLISIVCSLLVIIYRYECSLGSNSSINDGWQLFWITILRVYVLDAECVHSTDIPNITKSESVFILAIITLCFSAVYFFAAVTLIAVVNNESNEYVDVVTYVYIGTTLAAFVVDLALGAHFGMDLGYLNAPLPVNPPDDSELYSVLNMADFGMLRVGAFMMMSFSLKGYVAHAINIVLLILLVVYLIDNRNQANEHEHSIHKLGALNGYDVPKPVRQENPWQQQRNDVFPAYSRSHNNPVFSHDEVPPPPPHRHRENPLSDYTNTPYRSDSWLKSMNSNAAMGSRPFSYLEEPKRPIPVKPPVTPSSEPHWRRDAWSGPHVPDPDYSPPHARRLKSALKPAY